MNKDVININSEDDITDILDGIKKSKQKIVALDATESSPVLRSSVNVKLIKKSAEKYNKVVVLVTTDAGLIKFAMEYGLHVADSLSSKPYVPKQDDIEKKEVSQDEVAEEFVKPIEVHGMPEENEDEVSEETLAEVEKEQVDIEVGKDEDNGKLASEKSEGFLGWLKEHKVMVIVSACAVVLLVGFIVWAKVFAPAVDIVIGIKTSSNNFSENVKFTTEMNKEDAKAGVFYLQPETHTEISSVEFKATGKKDVGTKAGGKVRVWAYFNDNLSELLINANTKFVNGDKVYYSTEDVKFFWDEGADACENKDNIVEVAKKGCLLAADVTVSAAEPGEKYNLGAGSGDWKVDIDKISNLANPEDISGGSSEVVTVASQEDIDGAIKKITDGISDSDAKKKIMAKVSNTTFAIEASYKKDLGDIKVNVSAGDKVEKGNVTRNITYTIYVVDTVKLEEFIREKATLANDQKIYKVSDPFVEHFVSSDGGYTGKLKTSYDVGPAITDNEVLEKVKGKKTGDVQSLLKSINGVNNVEINKSYPWVRVVPDDSNKVTINIKVDE